MTKILVVYYSRTGNTEKVARSIADALHADIEPIIDKAQRKGIIGYLRSGYEAGRRRETSIRPLTHALRDYDLVVIGTPVWNANVSSPTRTFIARHRKDFKRVAFFCTCGGRGAKRAFHEMETASGKNPADVLSLREAELRSDYSEKIARFVREIRMVTEPVSVSGSASPT